MDMGGDMGGQEELSAGGKFRAAVHAVNFVVGHQASPEDPFSGMPVGNDGMGQTMQIPEVTKLREWETKHEEELEETARKEEAAKRQTRQSAADELAKWYAERQADLSKRL